MVRLVYIKKTNILFSPEHTPRRNQVNHNEEALSTVKNCLEINVCC